MIRQTSKEDGLTEVHISAQEVRDFLRRRYADLGKPLPEKFILVLNFVPEYSLTVKEDHHEE